MVAKSGDLLLLQSAINTLQERLFPLTMLLTPNLLEASNLLGREIQTKQQMGQAAIDSIDRGPKAVVVKGGHLKDCADDCLCFKNPEWKFIGFRV